MLCFKDKSFCIAFDVGMCINSNCHRAFTPEQAEAARRWWGEGNGDAPVAISDFSRDCGQIIRALTKDGA